MTKYKYTWEAFDVETEDGYILTTFHVTGSTETGKFSPDKGTLLIQHGNLQDAASWIDCYSSGKPMPLILADRGYDVWMGNNRGTEYSLGSSKGLDPSMQEFWAWSWAEMGVYDDTANINMIKQKTGKDKIFYIGYSQGTVQMFYGLIKKGKEISDNLHKYVALAPCTVAGESTIVHDYENTLFRLQDLGIYATYNTPSWNHDLKRACKELSLEYCLNLQANTIGGAQTEGVQDALYWNYNSIQDRFQEWDPNYQQGEK